MLHRLVHFHCTLNFTGSNAPLHQARQRVTEKNILTQTQTDVNEIYLKIATRSVKFQMVGIEIMGSVELCKFGQDRQIKIRNITNVKQIFTKAG